jgi:hypothetical protein
VPHPPRKPSPGSIARAAIGVPLILSGTLPPSEPESYLPPAVPAATPYILDVGHPPHLAESARWPSFIRPAAVISGSNATIVAPPPVNGGAFAFPPLIGDNGGD